MRFAGFARRFVSEPQAAMQHGDKSKHADKQERKSDHIAEAMKPRRIRNASRAPRVDDREQI